MRHRLKRQEIEPGFKDDGDIEDEDEDEEESGVPSQEDMDVAPVQQVGDAAPPDVMV